MHPAVVDDGKSQRISQTQLAGRDIGRVPVEPIEKGVLGVLHHGVGPCFPQQAVQMLIPVEAGVPVGKARQIGAQLVIECCMGRAAIGADEQMQIAGTQGGLSAAVGQVAGIARQHGDGGIIAAGRTRFKDVDDGLGGAFLEAGKGHGLPA